MLKELAQKAKAINVQELAFQVAKANEGLILKRQREQLEVGENSDGNDIGKYKTINYSQFKRSIGSKSPFGIADLKLSGKLQSELEVKFSKSKFEINSNVEYSKYQVNRYGKNIYGLQNENAKDIRFKNSIEIVKEYSKALGL